MALPAGRVGVKRTEVDWQGKAKGSSSGGGGGSKISAVHDIELYENVIGLGAITQHICTYFTVDNHVIIQLDMQSSLAGDYYADYIIAEGLPIPLDNYFHEGGWNWGSIVNIDGSSYPYTINIYVDKQGRLHYQNRMGGTTSRKYFYLDYYTKEVL